jgi:hypothetical protein
MVARRYRLWTVVTAPINPEAAQRAGLHLSSTLLSLARI